MENDVSNLYELVDLQIARCRLMLASLPDADLDKPRLKIATKYTRTAREWFAQQGRQIEAVKLYGSMELAPLVDLADLIVDIVDTGNTLRANGMEPLAEIASISSRLVVNKAAMRSSFKAVREVIDDLTAAVAAQ